MPCGGGLHPIAQWRLAHRVIELTRSERTGANLERHRHLVDVDCHHGEREVADRGGGIRQQHVDNGADSGWLAIQENDGAQHRSRWLVIDGGHGAP